MDLFSIDVTNVDSSGEEIYTYGTQLQQLLEEFDSVVSELTTKGMTGYMSDQALNAYSSVKDNLSTYAQAITNVGTAISISAERTQATAIQAGDSITVSEQV